MGYDAARVPVPHPSAIEAFAGRVHLVRTHRVVYCDWARKGEPVWLSVSVKRDRLVVRSGYASSCCIVESGRDGEAR